MWTAHAGKISEELTGSFITGRNLKVCQYREKAYLKVLDSSVLNLDPCLTDQTVSSLQQWWKNEGKTEDFDELDIRTNNL